MTKSTRLARIAVDASGGDIGPAASVAGAVQALAEELRAEIVLYGDPQRIAAVLAENGAGAPTPEVVACSQDIAMDAAAAAAVRANPDSPIVRAMRDQRDGRIDAVVSAGSTGAMVAASLLILGRLGNATRPAIATFIPTLRGETLLLDAGANTQATPELLLSFARMGSAYCRAMHHVDAPTIGLLNIGSEATKGSELTVATHELLRSSELNFAGNVEGNELLQGPCDVLITDGFTGNIVLKAIEGLAQFMAALGGSGQLTAAELAGLQALGGVFKRRFSYEVYGGAPLLGVGGVSIICHGRSTPAAFTQAIKIAAKQVQCGLPQLIDQALAAAAEREG